MPLLNAYVGVAVLFAVIIYGFEVCMIIREWYYLRNVGFPVMFADFLTVTEFETQRTQKQLLMESEVISRTVDLLLEVLLLCTGAFALLWKGLMRLCNGNKASMAVWREILVSVLFTLSITLIHKVVSIPTGFFLWLLYGRPVSFIDVNSLVSMLAGTLSLVSLYRSAPKAFCLIGFGSVVLATVLGSVLSNMIIKYAPWYTKLPFDSLGYRITHLCEQVGFDSSRVYVTGGKSLNAYSTGYMIVIFQELIKQFEASVVVATVAHELGHWALGHGWKQGLVLIGMTGVSCMVLHLMLRWDSMYTAFGFVNNSTEVKEVAETSTTAINTLTTKKRSTTKYVVIGLLLSQYMAAPLYSASTYLFRFRQHAQEFEADAFAVDLGHAVPLIELLVRLHAISDAVGSDVLYDALHETHPSAKSRVLAIEKRLGQIEGRGEASQ